MIKGTIYQEDTTLINIYVSNQGAPKYITHIITYLKGEADQKKYMVGDLNTSLIAMTRSPKKKTNKKISTLNNTLDQMH